ncbi:MAG: hypothetical protein ABTD50_15660 [Polyangiaceae bacterium]|jgi:hypothetical protein
MAKNRFPQESVTAVDRTVPEQISSGPRDGEKSEKPTVPPPRLRRGAAARTDGAAGPGLRRSGVRPTPGVLAATVDLVVADMSKDPRREREG